MAIRPTDEYPGKVAAPTADYPDGKAQNITSPGDGTGTPWEAKLVNDIFGFQQFITSEAGITPSGTPDNATASQYFEAIWKLLNVRSVTHNIAADTNYTLTAAQNIYTWLTVTDTGVLLTAGRDIIIDAVGRFLLFTNSTAQILTVKVSGGSGIAVPAGVTTILVSDGTEVTLLQTADPISAYDLANKQYVDTVANVLPTITGTFTATNATNNINLTGIGSLTNLEVGDVIQISGTTTAQNDGYFTVEVITDANNIIVNEAHKGKSRTVAPIGEKALIDEVSTSNVTISIFAKWYNVAEDLGQGWVDVTAERTVTTVYSNLSGRTINVKIFINAANGDHYVTNTASRIDQINRAVAYLNTLSADISDSTTYFLTAPVAPVFWKEKR